MDVLEVQTADDWEDIVSRLFVPLSCLSFEDRFYGRMAHLQLDDRLAIASVTTAGTSAERTARTASHADSDDLHLSLQVNSTGIVSQNERRVRVSPGSVTTYATDEAYHLDYSAPAQRQLIVQVSRSSLGIPNRLIDDSCRRLLVPSNASTRTLFTYASALQDRAPLATATGLDELAETTRDLAATMIRSSFTASGVMPQTSAGLLATIEDHLRHHATDAGLSLEAVAHRHYISRRKLYLLFERVGTTPADYLRRHRLGLARTLLAAGSIPVGEVAFRAGFSDPTTFARAFRREYGCTPREFRGGGAA
ncbi:AraC family transcriptional regulator [Agromyces archimandritae]|uniref:AraC family transcriptional regulator n=1 Tax=Agromyces archimandritae TaxID=2781962 RepID=A0A975IMW0_9MICO|nr:AraC family transcriptional regulator [Agromyces archimandritae]QTX03589.1 AraC family transcriptional regulator [Agromyces archimandritae]